MEPTEKNIQGKNDFSIIFKKIEEFNEQNSSFSDMGINNTDVQNDQTIREFSEICRQINDTSNNPIVYNTFS